MNENVLCISILIILLATIYIYTDLCNTKTKLAAIEGKCDDLSKSITESETQQEEEEEIEETLD